MPAPSGQVVEADLVVEVEDAEVESVVEQGAAEVSAAPKFVSPYSQNVNGA
jgi:hypothetical protein